MSRRTTINEEVATYWKKCKAEGLITYHPVKKKTHPSFTRHNGKRLNRLKDSGWRFPRSTQGNRSSIAKPCIGYKNPESVRHCLRAYGKRITIIHNEGELRAAVLNGSIPVFARRLGCRSRARILTYAKEQNLPLMLRR